MDTQHRVTPPDTRSPPIDARRRHKLRQHAASLATGAVVFVVAIGLMQALKPPAAGTTGPTVPTAVASTSIAASSTPAERAPSFSGRSSPAATAAGAEETEETEPATPPAKPLPAYRDTPATPVRPATPATPTNAKSTAAQIMGMPSIYIHVLNESTREQALKLAPALEKQGIALAGIKVVSAGPRGSDLRYFRPSEKEEAQRVQAALLSLGLPAQRLKSISGFETSAVPRQYELWLVSDYRG